MFNQLIEEKNMSSGSAKNFIKNNAVVIIALVVAVISCILVLPDEKYIEYIDYRTLSTLFVGLAIVTGLDRIHVFKILSKKIVVRVSNLRSAVLALLYITFIGSMIIANDMALITFLPLGYYVLSTTKQEKYMAFTFIMQNIAANLGGMLTPFGNPQNLYIYSYFNIPINEFLSIMILPFLVSIVMITLSCFAIPKIELLLIDDENIEIDRKRLGVYSVLFVFFLGTIFRLIDYRIVLLVIIVAFIVFDKMTLKKLDYGLLFTFFFFFIFAGNVARIDVVSDVLSGLLEKSTLLTGVISCQFISNVPSAILLSKFTTNYPDLLVAVNIGGTGTLIASLASLITYKEYVKREPEKQWYYIKMFSALNFGFLGILTVFSVFVL